MAIGDKTDIYNRLIAQLPNWFGTDHSILDAILAAYVGFSNSPTQATTAYFHYNFQYAYAKLQLRIQTATDINLDLISEDYLGNNLPRYPNENDDSYRARILANVVRERATRLGMSKSIYILTGFYPVIIEPFNGADHGYYNIPSTLAYNAYGSYGSNSYPYQAWIYVYINAYQGMAGYPGYNLNSFVSAAVVVSGGTNYAVGDTITLAGGTFTSASVLRVTSVSAGVVTEASIATAGAYNEPLPSNPLSQQSSSGAGTGATFDVTFSAYTPYLAFNSSGFYGGESLETAIVTENDVLQLIENTKVAGTLMHVFFIYV